VRVQRGTQTTSVAKQKKTERGGGGRKRKEVLHNPQNGLRACGGGVKNGDQEDPKKVFVVAALPWVQRRGVKKARGVLGTGQKKKFDVGGGLEYPALGSRGKVLA